MVLQQQVNLLDKFVIQQESIPHLVNNNATTIRNIGHPAMLLKTNDVSMDQYSKSVSDIV